MMRTALVVAAGVAGVAVAFVADDRATHRINAILGDLDKIDERLDDLDQRLELGHGGRIDDLEEYVTHYHALAAGDRHNPRGAAPAIYRIVARFNAR